MAHNNVFRVSVQCQHDLSYKSIDCFTLAVVPQRYYNDYYYYSPYRTPSVIKASTARYTGYIYHLAYCCALKHHVIHRHMQEVTNGSTHSLSCAREPYLGFTKLDALHVGGWVTCEAQVKVQQSLHNLSLLKALVKTHLATPIDLKWSHTRLACAAKPIPASTGPILFSP